ncbi:MAG: transporter [Bacteroidota bacterium]
MSVNGIIFTGSFCFNYLPSETVGLFAEYFTYIPDAWPGEHGIDAGITYLLAPQLQIDLSAGVSYLEKGANLFVSSGFSVRID